MIASEYQIGWSPFDITVASGISFKCEPARSAAFAAAPLSEWWWVMTIEPGDIPWFRFSRPDKRPPVLVLGRPELVVAWSRIPVIPISTQTRGFPWEMKLGAADGLLGECILKPEWIDSVERHSLGTRIATLPANRWEEVRRVLLYSLGLDAF
jgi:mRNA-degrading endonuclease toxin of MazEF toxin-antitoxin module